MLERIAVLKQKVISLDKRFQNYDGKTHCLISVDGTDCPIMEPWPFEKKWYSQKFIGPALKYEVGVCIKTGYIVWVNGPFVGSENDGTIFTQGLATFLAEDEGVEVDGSYKGHSKFKGPTVAMSRHQRKEKSIVRGR
jgi:hypothetical protein